MDNILVLSGNLSEKMLQGKLNNIVERVERHNSTHPIQGQGVANGEMKESYNIQGRALAELESIVREVCPGHHQAILQLLDGDIQVDRPLLLKSYGSCHQHVDSHNPGITFLLVADCDEPYKIEFLGHGKNEPPKLKKGVCNFEYRLRQGDYVIFPSTCWHIVHADESNKRTIINCFIKFKL